MYVREVTVEDRVFRVPFFTAKDLALELGIARTTVRTWLQNGWLRAARGNNGYAISYVDLNQFFEKYGSRLRSIDEKGITEFMDDWKPQDITEEKRREELEKREREERKKGYLAYCEWVRETYQIRKQLAGRDWILKDLVELDDKTVAAKSRLPLPEGSLQAVEETKREDHSYAFEWGETPTEIKKSLLLRCMDKELGVSAAFRRGR